MSEQPSEQPTEWQVEYREAEDGSAGSWTRTDGTRGGSSTLPTRYRRYVTPWVLDRPRKTFSWSTDVHPPASPSPDKEESNQ